MLPIERVPLQTKSRKQVDLDWRIFLETIPELEVGESVLIKNVNSKYRVAALVAKYWLNITLHISHDGNGSWRIGRIK